MALRFSRVSAMRPSVSPAKPSTFGKWTRFLATVEGNTGNTLRQMPARRAKASPVSHGKATFTIRVCEVNPRLLADLCSSSLAEWPRIQRRVFRCQMERFRRSRLHNFSGWLPGITDGPILSWPNSRLYATSYW